MSEQRKFRAWDKNKERFYTHFDTLNILANRCYGKENAESIPVMQYTGLKDKNGKEIYEGDIVCMTFRENIGTFNVPDDIIANGGYTGRDDVYEGKVVYNADATCYGVEDKESGFMQLVRGEDIVLEVIGNIYETGGQK